MKSTLKTMVLFFLGIIIGLFSGCAVATKKIPIREIDRPISMPAGIKQVSANISPNEFNHNYFLFGAVDPLFQANVTYAVTDKITFANLPFPVIQYQFYGTNYYNGDTVKTPNLASAIIGGIETSGYFYFSKYDFIPRLEVLGKKILNNNFWLMFDINGESINSDALFGAANLNLGYQIGNRNAFAMGITMEAFKKLKNEINDDRWPFNEGNSGMVVYFPIGWKLNVTNWWSVGLNFNSGFEYVKNKTVGIVTTSSGNCRFSW
jgi:hypothetical protein